MRAKTLFATHYHELTTLSDHLDCVYNVHVAADESDGEVTFLRTARDGPTDRSYGIHVADLAGVPEPVVERSRDVLDRLREEKAIEAKGSGGEPVQAVFDLGSGEFRTEGATPETTDGARGEAAAADGSGQGQPADPLRSQFGEDAVDVLDALADVDVNGTPPVKLLAKVQEWQERIDESSD